MDRIDQHLDFISLTSAALIVGTVTALFFMVPLRHRLEAALAAMTLTLTLSGLPGLDSVAHAAKICSGLVFVLVSIAAIQSPGHRSRLPVFYWTYLLIGLLGVVFVVNTIDSRFALIVRSQWLMLALAAVLTARTVVDEQSLRRVLRAIFIGLSICCILTVSTVLQNPWGAFSAGFGRFTPYQCNPNQVGVMFAITTSLALYFSLTTRTPLAQMCCIGCAALAFGQSVLTVSRGSFLILSLTSLPSVLIAFRQPIFAMTAVCTVVGVFAWLIGLAEPASFDRLDRDLISRTDTTLEVVEEVRERPWFGLGFSHDRYAIEGDLNAHNAYVAMLYLGGLSLALPLFTLQAYGHSQMLRAWRARRRLPFSPLLINVLFGFSLALFAHGFVNDMGYYPTYVWAFLNVFIACLSNILGNCSRRCQSTPLPIHTTARTQSRTFHRRPTMRPAERVSRQQAS